MMVPSFASVLFKNLIELYASANSTQFVEMQIILMRPIALPGNTTQIKQKCISQHTIL